MTDMLPIMLWMVAAKLAQGTLKKCSKCQVYLPLSSYGKNRAKADGLQHYCLMCQRESYKKWKDENPEKAKESYRVWYKNNAEKAHACSAKCKKNNSEKYKEISRIYREKNKEKVREATKKWVTENPEKARLSGLNWAHKNPDAKKAKDHRRRAKKRNNGGCFTSLEWRELCEKYENKCLCCGEKKKLEADHVIPVIEGGGSEINNIQPLCRSCNARKGATSTDYRKVFYG